MNPKALKHGANFAPLVEQINGRRVGIVRSGSGLCADIAMRGLTALLGDSGVSFRFLTRTEMDQEATIQRDVGLLLFAGSLPLDFTHGYHHKRRLRLTGAGFPALMCHPDPVDPEIIPADFEAVFTDRPELVARHPLYRACPHPGFALPHAGNLPLPAFERGQFLEGSEVVDANLGSALSICDSIEDLQSLVGLFESVRTDQVATAALAAASGRAVWLAGNRIVPSHGIRTGERPVDDPAGGLSDLLDTWLPRLSARPSRLVPFHCRPLRVPGCAEGDASGPGIYDSDGQLVLAANDGSLFIWRLCSGELTVEEMIHSISEAFGQPLLRLARDIQDTLSLFLTSGLVTLDRVDDGSPDRIRFPLPRRPGRARSVRLRIQPPVERGETVRLSAHVRLPGHTDRQVWFEMDRRQAPALTGLADAFLLCALPLAMQNHCNLWLEGAAVSQSLLHNLESFQAAWIKWDSNLGACRVFAPVTEPVLPGQGRRSLLGFSGGIDSTYSLYRHLVQADRDGESALEAVMLVHGFDVPIDDENGFREVQRRVDNIVAHTSAERIILRTNVKTICHNWDFSHSLALAGALHLFAGHFDRGLIASTMPDRLPLAHGSNPVTDPLLGSDDFRIASDASAVTRLEKVGTLSGWSPALQNVRFCFTDRRRGNCGRCPKCVVTAAMFRVAGRPLEPIFGTEIDDDTLSRRILGCRYGALEIFDLRETARAARENGETWPWIDEVLRAED